MRSHFRHALFQLISGAVLGLLGCGNPGDETTTTTTTATTTTNNSDLLPLEEIQCGANYKAPGTGVTPGSDLFKVTLPIESGAVCNDGSPAILYVRRAADAESESLWVFHLQGGGECAGDDAACVDRWCGRQGKYDAAKMSSMFAPPAMKGSGILLRDDKNTFGRGNQVYFYYCSSDNWAGRKSDVAIVDAKDGGKGYGVHYRGHTILQVAVEQMLAEGIKSDDGSVVLPRLDTATLVLWTGSSGGAGGVMANGDWLASHFDPTKTDVRLVMDASLFPLFEHVSDTMVRDTVKAQFIEQADWLVLTDAHVDQSCAEAHPGSDLWSCDWNPHIRLNHLTTPFFQRQDLGDPNASAVFEAAGATKVDFAGWQRETALAVPAVQSAAEEGKDIARVPGIYGPACGQHVALLNDDWFFVSTVADANGAPVTFHDALRAWVDGTDVAIIDTIPPTLTECAATTSDTD